MQDGERKSVERDRVAEIIALVLAVNAALPVRDHLAREWHLGRAMGTLLFAALSIAVCVIIYLPLSAWRRTRRASAR